MLAHRVLDRRQAMLSAASCLVTLSVNRSPVTTDIDGDSRIEYAPPDIGADEFTTYTHYLSAAGPEITAPAPGPAAR